MRLVIASAFAIALGAGVIAPAISQNSGQPVTSRAYMVEPYAPPSPVTINGTGVRLRAEPFATNDTPVLSTGSTGLQLTVVGIARQSDWNWYQVILRNGQKAFIRSDLTSAPSRGNGAPAPVAPNPAAYPPPVQPVNPTVITPPVVTPPVISQPPVTLPLPAAQPLPPIQSQPLNNGAISLTPGASPQLPPLSNPAPVDNGLLSVSPTAPAPSFAPVSSSLGAGDLGQNIRAQLDAKRCWTDSSNMMDAQRLKASFALTFNNGRFAAEPRLVEPAAEPANDPAMMVFLAKARAALRTCNALGFDVPTSYAPGSEVRVDFSAR
jgi:hypothetical protein